MLSTARRSLPLGGRVAPPLHPRGRLCVARRARPLWSLALRLGRLAAGAPHRARRLPRHRRVRPRHRRMRAAHRARQRVGRGGHVRHRPTHRHRHHPAPP
eukprot:3021026-Prymnesium_polylepis.1